MISRTKLTVLVGSAVLLTALLALGLATVSAAPGVDLRIEKRATGLPGIRGVVIAGEELIYEIDVYNWGNITATDVVVDDDLPWEVIYLGSSPEVCDLVGTYPDELECYLGDMDPGEHREFQVKVLVAPWAVFEWEDGFWDGTITMNNYAEVYSEEDDDDYSDNEVDHFIFVEDSADLTVVKMSKPDTYVRAGELFTYTIYVENLGPSIARFVGMRDNILSSGDFELVDLYTNRDELGESVWCEVEATEPGISNTIGCGLWFLEPKGLLLEDTPPELYFDTGQWIITVVLRANETQDVNNLAEVFPLPPLSFEEPWIPTPDPDLSNNMAEDFIYVTDVANLWLDKRVEPANEWDEFYAGSEISYTLHVHNQGPSTAENVVIEDLLPAGVTVTYVDAGPGSCTTGIPGDPFAPLTCNVCNLAPDEGAAINVHVLIDPDYPLIYEGGLWAGILENDAWVYSDIFDPNNGDNRDHEIVPVYALSVLSGSKDCPESIVAGEEMEYRIYVGNEGPSTAPNLSFADTLDENVTFLDYEITVGDGSCSYDGGQHELVCSLGDVDPGEMRVIKLTVRVNPGFTGSLVSNDVPAPGAWWADTALDFGEASFYCETDVDHEADLSLVKTSEPMKLYPGEQKTYHIEVTNNGPTGAADVMVTDTLPISVTYEIDNGDCDLVATDPDRLECYLGNMMPGETKGFDVWALVSPDAPSDEITNEACVLFEGDDPDELNNCDTATNLVLEPIWADLEIYKDYECEGIPDNLEDCVAGGWINFLLHVYNSGPLTAENAVLEDLLPEGVTVTGYEGWRNDVEWPWPGLFCNTGIPGNPDAPFTCGLGSVAVGDHVEVVINAVIDPDYVDPELPDDVRVMENNALVYSDLHDPNNDNNLTSVTLDVATFSELAITKWGFPDVVSPGEPGEYEIRIRNLGPSTVDMVHFVDLLPEVAIYQGYWIEQGTGSCTYHDSLPWPWWDEWRGVHCYVDEIAPNGIAMVHLDIVYSPDSELYEDYVEHVCNVIPDDDPFSDFDDNYGVDDDWNMPGWFADSYIVIPFENSRIFDNGDEYFGWCPDDWEVDADLSVRKYAEPWKVYAGEQVMYTIEVTNNGPANAYDVDVDDYLPDEVAAELVTDPDCDIYLNDSYEVDCDWEMLAVGETRTFYIFGRVLPEAEPGTVSNSVEVEHESGEDPVEYNDYASAPILIQGRADLKINKFGKPDGLVRAGDELIYTLIVDNLGTGYAREVTIDDVLESNGTFELLDVSPDRDALCNQETGTFEHDMFLSCTLSDTLEVKGTEPGSGRWMVTVVVRADEPQDINNIAYVAAAEYDPDLSNNEAIAEHEITAVADLELTKEAWGEMLVGCEGETDLWLDEVAAGATVTYTLTVSNTGPSTAENVVLLDEPLPELLEIDLDSVTPSQGTCITAKILSDRRLTCNLGTIAPEESATVTFVAYVPSAVPDDTLLDNTAQVYSDMFDDNNGNDIVTNHTRVSRVADLMVEKAQDPEIALPYWDVTYTVTVTNLGPSDAEGVIISDTLPVEVLNPTWTCCASDDGECQVPCQLPTCPQGDCPWPEIGIYAQADIPAGGWAIYTVEGTLDWWPCGPFTNTVELIPPQSLTHPPEDIDPCDENNTDLTVNDPFCHFDPLVLKDYPGPDSTG